MFHAVRQAYACPYLNTKVTIFIKNNKLLSHFLKKYIVLLAYTNKNN